MHGCGISSFSSCSGAAASFRPSWREEVAVAYRAFMRGRLRPISGAAAVFSSLLMVWQSGARLLVAIGARPQVHFELPIFFVFGMTLHLTTGSSRSLRSLGRAKARPLTKRYV